MRGRHGLGLAIVRAVAHRADLSAAANPTGGLAVTVTFRHGWAD